MRLAQNNYTGLSHKDVRWLGAIGANYGVIAVSSQSEYKTLSDLTRKISQQPQRVKISGRSAAGGWDHLKLLLLAKKAGMKELEKVNYISFSSGGNALIELIGRRVDAFTGDTSEVLSHFDSGSIRVLAVFSPQRITRLDDTPTARERGYEVIGANWRGFYAPPGISDQAYRFWAKAVQKVAQSKEWARLAEKNGLAPFQSFGEDFQTFLNDQIKEITDISQDLGLIK